MSDKLTTRILLSLADDDAAALDEYGAAVAKAAGDKALQLSRSARVRALFRLGVDSWRCGAAENQKQNNQKRK